MALKVLNPADGYDHIFMISQSLHQRTIDAVSDDAYYTLSLVWTYYKVEEDGSIVYSPNDPVSYYDENFYVSAVTDYMSGNAIHFNTLTAQQASIKHIVEAFTGLSLEAV